MGENTYFRLDRIDSVFLFVLHIYGDSRIICQLSGRADVTLQKGGRASKVKPRIVQADVGSGKLLAPEPSGNWCVL